MTTTVFMWAVVILLFIVGAAIEYQLKKIVDILQDIKIHLMRLDD